MNAKLFKKLIKDAVTEALYEELPDIINEVLEKNKRQQLKEMKTSTFSTNDIHMGGGGLSPQIREQLAMKMGNDFGFSPAPSLNSGPKILEPVNETGDKVNPFAEFIQDAAKNMTAADRSGLRNLE